MQYRTLGKTGLKVSEVGYGTWQLADDPNCWRGADLNESLRCLYRYAELGGNFIDTAWVYGYDDKFPDRHPSEELIGKFLKESGRRDDMVIASKVVPKNYQWPAQPGVPISEVFPNDHIIKCVDDSLRSLGVDSIDLMQFHVWDDSFVKEDGWKDTIQKLTKAGKVKHWGISTNNYEPANCLKALDTGLISVVQTIFNIFHQKPTEELFPYALAHNIGIIARVPLDEGGLSGNMTLDTKFPEGTLHTSYFGGERLAELVKRTEALKKLLGEEAKTLPELALRYTLSFYAVSTTIPGMRKLGHVESNVAATDGKILSTKLLAELKNHAWERNFYKL